MTAAKFELAFTRCRNNLKTVRDLIVRNSLQDFDAIERYLHPKCQSVFFQKTSKIVLFLNFQVFTRCRFQNVPIRVPFSRSTVFKICRQKMCRFRVNRRPIRRIFHRFQNVPASCERSLNVKKHICCSVSDDIDNSTLKNKKPIKKLLVLKWTKFHVKLKNF